MFYMLSDRENFIAVHEANEYVHEYFEQSRKYTRTCFSRQSLIYYKKFHCSALCVSGSLRYHLKCIHSLNLIYT